MFLTMPHEPTSCFVEQFNQFRCFHKIKDLCWTLQK
jgi:hypothetical protein